jgi:hypothetical protein
MPGAPRTSPGNPALPHGWVICMEGDAAIRVRIAAELARFYESLPQIEEDCGPDPLPVDAGAPPSHPLD